MAKLTDDGRSSTLDLDTILAEIGNFGKFQRSVYFLICIFIGLDALGGLAFVFTAADLNYRLVKLNKIKAAMGIGVLNDCCKKGNQNGFVYKMLVLIVLLSFVK